LPNERTILSTCEWRIPLSDLDYGAEEEEAALRVVRSKWLSAGPEVEAFEREFAALIGVRHAIAVANGTAALHLSYLAVGVGPGDEVIQPAINFVAAANMTVAVGATPVFAEILGLGEPTIAPAEVERSITPRTKAVVVMHYGGYPCRMVEIERICRERGVSLIEDACHGVGARYLDEDKGRLDGKMLGSLGDIGCFSFFSNKNLATGEGGMVVTDQDDVAHRVRLLRSHGMTTLTWDRHQGHASSYGVAANGYNYRLDDLHAALGRVQLRKLAKNNERRRGLVEEYWRHLALFPRWVLPFVGKSAAGSGHLMAVVAPGIEKRAQAAHALKEARIQTSLHYPCVADFEAFHRFGSGRLKHSRTFADRAITLPLFPTLRAEQVEEVCRLIREACA